VGQYAKRILIDCSHVDFTRQPTGIPRVVLKYIEVGYEWGRRTGVEVIPVTPTGEGLSLYRPIPGRNPPQDLVLAADGGNGAERSLGAELAGSFFQYVADVLHNLLSLGAALVPLTAVKVSSRWVDFRFVQKVEEAAQRMERFVKEPLWVEPRLGDVVLTPAYWHDVDPEIYRNIRAAGAKIVVLVHDLLPILFDRFYPAPWCYEFKENVKAAFGYADAFLCVSNSTRSALIEFGTRQKQKMPPIMTAYNGFDPLVEREVLEGGHLVETQPSLKSMEIDSVFGGPVRPFVMVGSIEPKKGHLPTIKCFEAIWRAGHKRSLVIIGRRGWLEQAIVDAIENSAFYGVKLFWFSDLDDFDLAQAYTRCHALIFSSFGEGFGLPMIEASFYGKPTVVLDTPIAREILGDAGRFFRNAETLIDRIIELEDPGRYANASEAAFHVSWPSWDQYTPRVLDQVKKVTADNFSWPASVPSNQ
jgi:glycosyltransferase involved in cell wall biosynthesis